MKNLACLVTNCHKLAQIGSVWHIAALLAIWYSYVEKMPKMAETFRSILWWERHTTCPKAKFRTFADIFGPPGYWNGLLTYDIVILKKLNPDPSWQQNIFTNPGICSGRCFFIASSHRRREGPQVIISRWTVSWARTQALLRRRFFVAHFWW